MRPPLHIVGRLLAAALFGGSIRPVEAAERPEIARLLPPGYVVIASGSAAFGNPSRHFFIAALGRKDESARVHGSQPAPARPLLLFERRRDGFVLAGRNDAVILRADEGGQCDPFLDGGGVIAVKGQYFTVENGVACGNHWTDYVTFRFDQALGHFVFDNERLASWSFNRSSDPDAEAMVPDGPPITRRSSRGHPVPFERWRRPP